MTTNRELNNKIAKKISESKMTLKTLQDLDIVADLKTGKDYVFKGDLRATAIKWVKEVEIQKKIGFDGICFTDIAFKKFFNITSEDLK